VATRVLGLRHYNNNSCQLIFLICVSHREVAEEDPEKADITTITPRSTTIRVHIPLVHLVQLECHQLTIPKIFHEVESEDIIELANRFTSDALSKSIACWPIFGLDPCGINRTGCKLLRFETIQF
jgi:hypothetical protein